MNIHCLEDVPSAALGSALGAFETQFSYPLGPGATFRISHGQDYTRFFRAIGRAACFVAEDDGRVLGTLAVVLRRLARPDGTEQTTAYLADLKVAPEARGSRALFRLAAAARGWAQATADTGFSIVMDGTRATPPDYTGRASIPAFRVLAKVLVLRIPAAEAAPGDGWEADTMRGERCYRELSRGRYATVGGTPRERSEGEPCWLLDRDQTACGLLEDTRRGKRLLADDGSELQSAHLSYFAFATARDGARLLLESRRRCAARGYPALFAAVAEADGRAVVAELGRIGTVIAPATVYGIGLDAGPSWNVNTAEI